MPEAFLFFTGNLTVSGGTVTDLIVFVPYRAIARLSLSRDVESLEIGPVAPGKRGRCTEQPCELCAPTSI